MRYILPIGLGILMVGCSLPKSHDPSVGKHPRIPYVEDTPSMAPLSDGSLWQDRLVVGDLRAYRLNDLVTIHIVESTNAISKADVNTAKTGSNNLDAPSLFQALGALGIGNGNTSPKTTATDQKFKGSGTTGRSAVFTANITARVVKVLGNGNLIFEGLKDIQLNNETQRLYIAGMLCPARLDTTNTISSDRVAELRLGFGGSGIIDETLKPGYISRALNYVWPF